MSDKSNGKKQIPLILGSAVIAVAVFFIAMHFEVEFLYSLSIALGAFEVILILSSIIQVLIEKRSEMPKEEKERIKAQRRENVKNFFNSLFSTPKRAGWTIFFILLIGTGIAIAIVSNSGKGVPDKANAVVIAEQEVRKELKSPSTATFSQMSETTVTQNGDTWTVRGWVDAQNSFGATKRNNYTVVIKFSGNSYEVISCTVY